MKDALIKRVKGWHLGIWLGIAVAIYISYYLVITVKKNYEMQQEIGKLDQQIQDLELETQKLNYQIQYYQTDSYKEKEARARLGLQAPGEGVVILPNSDDTRTQDEETQQKRKKSNFEQWIEFLRGNGAS